MSKNQIVDSGGREVSVTDAKALKVDNSGVTQPVSMASSPLPTGAATETTLGTRLSESDFDNKIGSLTEAAPGTDTASSGLNGRLQRIAQRITSLITALGSPFQAGGSIGNTTFASTVADGANVNQGANADAAVVTDTTGTLSGKIRGLVKWAFERMPAALGQTTMANSLPVTLASNQSAVPVLDTNSAAIKTAVELIDNAVSGAGFNITQVGGTNIDTNSGNKSAGTQRVVIATDQPQLTTPLNVTVQSGATGGDAIFHLASAGSTNATVIKASAGKVTGWYIYNSNAAARKVAFHNSASSPTAGSAIYFTLMIPPSSGANVSFPSGIDFSAGIGITTVTGLADNDSAAVAANDLIINIFFR